LHPPSESVAISHWPKIPNFAFADAETLPVPALSDFDWLHGRPISFAEPFGAAGRQAHGAAQLRQDLWPQPSPLPIENAAVALPVPAAGVFEIPEKSLAVIGRPSHRVVEQAEGSGRETKDRASLTSADDGGRRGTRGRHHAARGGRPPASHIAARKATRPAAHAGRGKMKHLVQVKKRNV
jgi:hypothetical protein